jgi:hypothetical protein
MEYPSETTDAIGFEPFRLDEPYGIIVQNNPVNKRDPRGLEGLGWPGTEDTPYGLTPGQDFNVNFSATGANNTYNIVGTDPGYSGETIIPFGAGLDITLGDHGDMEIGGGYRYLGAGCNFRNGRLSSFSGHLGWGSFMGFPMYLSTDQSYVPNTNNPQNVPSGDLPDFAVTGGASD